MSPISSSAHAALERELRGTVRGDVRFDARSRALYATDASIYRVAPVGVVCPLDVEDVRAAVRIAAARGVPILPRGAGTSLAGQTVGAALVLDFSRHMHRILEIEPEPRRVRLEPGVVLATLNRTVSRHRLQFGPDVATADRACLGGMIGNNSSGAHSIVYGMTVDHVEALDIVLADGQPVTLDHASGGGSAADRRRDALREGVREIVERHAGAIARDYPPVSRRVMGYNLDAVAPQAAPWNLTPLLVGAEGTLATVVGATLRLVPLPPARGLAIVHCPDLFAAADQVPALLECRPSAVELLDRRIVELARESAEYADRTDFMLGEPGALLVVEVTGDDAAEVKERLAGVVRAAAPAPTVLRTTAAGQEDVWAVRRAGLAIVMRLRGRRKPVGFVEDSAVEPARLGDYLRRFLAILDAEETTAVFYGHASVGCLHIRPVLDLKSPEDVERMRRIAQRVADLVGEFGGALSGEHGDGRLRSAWIPQMLGPELTRAFSEVKTLFDPQGLMNPGVIVDPAPFDAHLRYRPDSAYESPITELDFRHVGGYVGAVELCNGNGACRKLDAGGMCPSYMVTRDEEHSTRGRAHLLQALLCGDLPRSAETEDQVRDALDLCLQCKACRRECPIGVDMTRLKIEFLSDLHRRRGVPLADRLFGHCRHGVELAARLPRLANWLARRGVVRAGLERLVGIDRRRSLPVLPRRSFRQLWAARQGAQAAAAPTDSGATVVLFDDLFTRHLEPEILMAAARVLEAAGERVKLPARPVHSGRPLLSRGLLREARGELEELLELLEPDLRAGLPVVGLEPSSLLTFRDELPALLPDDPRAELLAQSSFLIDEFMLPRLSRLQWRREPVSVLVHLHCHRQSLSGSKGIAAMLAELPGVEARIVDAGCCGMAGSFGYDRRHFDLSMAVAERKLLPEVRAAGADTLLVVEGTSCRHQVLDGTGRGALHPAELLALRLMED